MSNLPAKPEDAVNSFISTYGGPAGEFVRFNKEHKYVCTSDGEEIKTGTKCVCIFDQTQHGLIKFHEKGEPPTRHMGPMFGGYVPPARTDLGDTDKSLWPKGLNGEPVDPWKSQVLLPLKELDGDRLYIFQTMSLTGLRAVASLISECRQMAKRDPANYPVIELAVGAFEHRNPQIGTVKKPSFKIVGKASRDGIAAPQISTGAVLDDEIPF